MVDAPASQALLRAPPNAADFAAVAKKPIRVVVADADAGFGDRLEEDLLQRAGLVVAGRASTADDAFDLVRSETPDIAFVALDMPGAAAAAKRILDLTPTPPRVVLMSSDAEQTRPMGGASAYFTKDDGAPAVAAVVAALSMLSGRAGAAAPGAGDHTRSGEASSLNSIGLPPIESDSSTASIMRTTSNPISAEERGTLPV
jgi:DNA-binding NarL/FixJ family response regulator